MINLTEEEKRFIIALHEMLGDEYQTPESHIYAWELFDEYVNLDAFTSAVNKMVSASKPGLQNTPYDFNKGE